MQSPPLSGPFVLSLLLSLLAGGRARGPALADALCHVRQQRELLLAVLAALAPLADAATHAVLPGASIQAKINLAVAGDIIAIFGGTYNEDLTIDKAVRLVEVSGQQVILNGNVTFSGVTNCPPFEGFTVGSPGRGINVNNTTGLVFRNAWGRLRFVATYLDLGEVLR